MSIDWMRKIDFWLGVPLTFLLTFFLRFWHYFRPAVKTDAKNILLIELSEMGSTILADPLMQRLKQTPNCQLYFAIFAKNRLSLSLLNTVDAENIFTFRQDALLTLLIDCFKYIVWCRHKRIDTVLDLELFSRITALLTGVSGGANRVGFYRFNNEGLYRGDMLTHKVAYNPHIHIAKNFIALANALESKAEVPYSKRVISDSEIVLKQAIINPEDSDKVRTIIKTHCANFDKQRIVLINPNAGDLLPQRRWSKTAFQTVIGQLLTQYDDIIILITGAKNEFDDAQNLSEKIADVRCVNFAGAIDFLLLPALYDLSTVMLTNDSGPGHFCAVTTMPSVVLFGPETPELYGSLGRGETIYKQLACSPCVSAFNHRETPCRDNVCMQKISSDEVFAVLQKYLS